MKSDILLETSLITSISGPIGKGVIYPHRRGHKLVGRHPYDFIRLKRKRPKQTAVTRMDDCPCKAFAWADSTYTYMTPEQRLVWRLAIKKRKISPYDLFMSEALTLMNAGFSMPDFPSTSGGFNPTLAVAGTNYMAPNPCLSDYCRPTAWISTQPFGPEPVPPFTIEVSVSVYNPPNPGWHAQIYSWQNEQWVHIDGCTWTDCPYDVYAASDIKVDLFGDVGTLCATLIGIYPN